MSGRRAVGGVVRCEATGKRCLSFKEAAKLVNRARRRGERVSKYHCRPCGTWHFGHHG